MSTPGVEPGLSRPPRDILTTRRCGLLCLARPNDSGEVLASFQVGVFFFVNDGVAPELGKTMGIVFSAPPADGDVQPLPCSLSGDVLSVGLVV